MSSRGRHARPSGATFYRDALLLIGGIVVVGAIVFGALSLWASSGDDDPADTSSTVTTDPQNTTTTTLPPTTSTVAATAAPAPTVPDTTAPPATETTVRSARSPGDVRVVVLNSIGVVGLAGQVSGELAELGYQMAQADNYTPELSDTMIFHADGFAIEAVELAEAVPDSTVASDPDLTADWGVDVVVVIGRSYPQ